MEHNCAWGNPKRIKIFDVSAIILKILKVFFQNPPMKPQLSQENCQKQTLDGY